MKATLGILASLVPVFLNAAESNSAPVLFPIPASLKADGLPSIPRNLFDRIAPYTDFRSAALLDWNPSHREILISTRFADVPQIHRVSMPGGDRRQLTFYSDRVSQAKYNPANANEWTFEKDKGGDEFYQIFLRDESSGRTTLLTDGGRSRNLGAQWSHDGRWIAYTSSKRNGRDADIWICDPRNPSTARILLQTNDPGWAITDWSPDNRKLLLERGKSIIVADLQLLDVATGAAQKIGPDDSDHGYFGGRFTPDGKSAYVTTNVNGEMRSLALVDLTSHKLTSLSADAPNWDVEEWDLSKDGRYLAYVLNEDGQSKLHVRDTRNASAREVSLPSLPPGVINDLLWHNDSSELGFSLSSAQSPGDVYSVRIGSQELQRWTNCETGGLDSTLFVQPRLIHWDSFDGLGVSGWFYQPPARFNGPRPVIINIHGGPEGQSRPAYLRAQNYFLNELGIALIYPNVRGSSGYGTKYLNADNGVKREDSVKDIGALLDWIAEQPELDRSRILVMGGSYGGYMTLAVMTHYSDRVRCAIEAVGISNFNTFLQHTEAYRQDLRRVEYGDERDPKMKDFFETIAPLNNAQKITKPMFIIAGRNDPRVPWTEGQQMTEALRKNNVPTWFLIGEDEGHGFAKKRNQDYLFGASVAFVQQYLLN